MHNFRKLLVYTKGLDIVERVYAISKGFPRVETFGLTVQLKRAVISIILNIAEGSGCQSKKEFIRFLGYALRSKHEVIACLDIATKLGYLDGNDVESLEMDLEELSSMIVGLTKSLRSKK
jgi:four helix bundle protein